MANFNAFNSALGSRFQPQQSSPYMNFAQRSPQPMQARQQPQQPQRPQQPQQSMGGLQAMRQAVTQNPYMQGMMGLPNPSQYGAGAGGFSTPVPMNIPRMQLPQVDQFNYRPQLPGQINAPSAAPGTFPTQRPPAGAPRPAQQWETTYNPATHGPDVGPQLPGQINAPSAAPDQVVTMSGGGVYDNPELRAQFEQNIANYSPEVQAKMREEFARDMSTATRPDPNSTMPGAAWYQGPTEPGMVYMSGGTAPPSMSMGMPQSSSRGGWNAMLALQNLIASQPRGYAKGGRVKRFAAGGLNDMADSYGLIPDYVTLDEKDLLGGLGANFPVSEPGALDTPVAAQAPAAPAIPAAPAVPAQAAPAPGVDLTQLFSKYLTRGNPYADELKEARAAANKETEAFNEVIRNALARKDSEGPSKEEMYFRLAAAFSKPTRTGNFLESVGEASKTAAEVAAEQRKERREGSNEKLQLTLAAQKARMEAAKGNLTDLRTLAGEEMKDYRALATKAVEQLIASGKPQSEGGKAAQDMGLVPGTPEYQKYVAQYVQNKIESGDLFKQAMVQIATGNLSVAQAREGRVAAKEQRAAATLTPAEVKLRDETETALASGEQALGALSKAYELNPNTFTSSGPDVVQRKALELSGAPSEKLKNTRIMENLLGEQALTQLRTIFGGNPTEGERAILMDLQGSGAKSVEERAAIIKRAATLIRQRQVRDRKKLEDIKAGTYKSVVPAAGEAE